MYVLIIARGAPDERHPVNGIFEYDQARALTRAGCRVVFAALDLRSFRRRRALGFSRALREGIPVFTASLPLSGLPEPLFLRAAKEALLRLYREITAIHGVPDILHAHFADTAQIAALALKDCGVPLAVTEHGSLLNQKRAEDIPPAWRRAANRAYSGAAGVAAVSPALAENLRRHFGVEPAVIPNVVDTGLFFPGPAEKKAADGPFSVVSAGNLTDNKNMESLVKAFRLAFPPETGATLTIFGGGPRRAALEKMASDPALSGRLLLPGPQPRRVLAEAFRSSGCFALFSRSETFGVTFAEALACGTPVAAAHSGGPEFFITPKNGLLAPAQDVSAQAEVLRALREHNDRYDRPGISREIGKLVCPDAVAKALLEFYGRLLNRRP